MTSSSLLLVLVLLLSIAGLIKGESPGEVADSTSATAITPSSELDEQSRVGTRVVDTRRAAGLDRC